MEIEKAIETLLPMVIRNFNEPTPGEKQAIRLGIEALKGIQNCRHYPECPFTEPLPGEKKE